jgi:hypothetical protein
MKSIPPTAVPMRNLTPPPMPRTLLGVGPAADSAAAQVHGGARLEIIDDDGDQQLMSDDTDQHETQLMMRDDMRAQLKLGHSPVPVAAVSAPMMHDRSMGASGRADANAHRPLPDFQEPTPLESTGARHSFGPSRKPQAVAVAVGLLLLVGGVAVWSQMGSAGPASDGPQQPRELVPMATEAPHDPPPPPSVSVALPPPSPPTVALSALPDTPEKPSVSHGSSGLHGHKPAPSATPAVAPPVKPTPPVDAPKPPPGGEDLANPYR